MSHEPKRQCKAIQVGVAADRVRSQIARPKLPADAPKAHPSLGEPNTSYVYTDVNSQPLSVVYRYDNSDNSDKKEFRPFNLLTREWRAPEVRPLYRLDLLKMTASQREKYPVVIVEGEKCADAVNGLGILATSVYGSSGGITKTDFSSLTGRHVIIWPDFDDPGFKYAERVALSLCEIDIASVRIVQISDATLRKVTENAARTYTYTLRKGWDAADAIAEGWSVDQLLAFLNAAKPLADVLPLKESPLKKPPLKEFPLRGTDFFKETRFFKEQANDDPLKKISLKETSLKEHEWGEPDMSILNPRPKPPEFPTYLFGPFWAKWIMRQAEAKSAPEDYVGASLLVAASTAIGNARWVSPWEGWREPPHLWAALVGNPSSGKSPAMDPVMDLLRRIEAEEAGGHSEALRQHEADIIAANYVRDQWEKDVKKAAKEGYPPPIKPDAAIEPLKPHRPRLRVSDATPEALLSLLSQLSKGVLMTRDELAGWLGSFNRYSGGEGGDRAFWLEAWGGRSYTVDRIKNEQAITIPHLSVSVLGGIQPDKLANMLLKGGDDGLTARFMYFWPNPVPLERPQCIPEGPEALNALKALHGLEMGMDEHGNMVPITAPLTEEAAEFFHHWRVQHRNNEPEGALLSWWGKMPGICLRLALSFEGLWNGAEGKGVDYVCKQAVEAASVMIDDYLKPMATRAFGDVGLSDENRNAVTLAKWLLKKRPEQINSRVLQREIRLPGLKNAKDIKGVIEVLIDANWLHGNPKRNGKTVGKMSGDFLINERLFE